MFLNQFHITSGTKECCNFGNTVVGIKSLCGIKPHEKLHDIQTEYLTLFWFAIVNEYKLEYVSIQKVRKMQNLGNVYICGSPFVMSRTDAQNGLFLGADYMVPSWPG